MARELKLRVRRENADIGSVGRKARGQHEHGFRQIELAGDGLHLPRCQPARIQDDGEGVSARGRVVKTSQIAYRRSIPSLQFSRRVS